jgi:putative transcriptional regulator
MSKTITSGKTLRRMTSEAVEAAARADRDAQPLPPGDLKRRKRTPQAKIIRRALALTQEEFAIRYHIPLGTLRTGSKAARNRTNQPKPISR